MKCYIYKITNEDESIVFIGSSPYDIEKKWKQHQSAYKRWLGGGKNISCIIYPHFWEHGIDKFSIKLMSEHRVGSIDQQKELKQLAIDTTDCLNKEKPPEGLTLQEYRRKLDISRKAEIIHCGCGSDHRRSGLSEHQKTYKHQRWLQSQ